MFKQRLLAARPIEGRATKSGRSRTPDNPAKQTTPNTECEERLGANLQPECDSQQGLAPQIGFTMSYTVFVRHHGELRNPDTGDRFDTFLSALRYMDAMYEAKGWSSVVYETGREFHEEPITYRPKGVSHE